MKIRSDVPPEIIKLIEIVDWERVYESQLQNWANQLKELALQYKIIHRQVKRTDEFIEIDVPKCPQKVGNFVSEFDFSNIPHFKIKLAYQFIKAKLPEIIPVKHT